MEISESRLHRALVTADGVSPSRWLLALHGILGSGGNLRSLARRLVGAAPDWGVALVDLRMHGLSQGFAPPHTLAAAAGDLVALEAELPGPVAGALGHSFGGKAAMAYAKARADRGARRLERLIVLDASPSPRAARSGSTAAIVAMLEALPQPFPSRQAFLEQVRAQGISAATAEWLAMNVARADDGFRLRLDLAAIRALLEDYFSTDLWDVLESGRAADRVDVVVAGRSDVFDAQDRARLDELGRRGLAHVHVLANAGHWLHVDDPEGVFGLSRAALLDQAAPP